LAKTDALNSELQLKKEKLELLELQLRLQKGLPHLYLHKLFSWQREFIESKNRMNLITSANQSGKSTGQIIKVIKWATEKDLWKALWPGQTPDQFWYLYPDVATATIEFHKKWKKYLPKGVYKDDPVYGWTEEISRRSIFAIHFNSGVSVYFKTYGQREINIQSSTLYAVFTDEELPEEIYDELQARIFRTGGYFNMVFTATTGQEIWRCTMEEKGSKEKFPNAFKRQISMYNCMFYEDGTPSDVTEDMINAAKNAMRSEAEIQRRIYGRFVLDSGRIYESFDPKENIVKPYDIPENWFIYAGIDIGGGGPKNHPSAIALVAVRPDFKKAACFMIWRGDEVITTAKDVVEKYISLTKGLDITACYYDWHCKDFETVAISMEVPVYPAEKSHDIGEGLLNVLFKNKMLDIFDTPETYKLTNELIGLKFETVKHKAVDDLCDALRYACAKITFDFSDVDKKVAITVRELTELEQRKRGVLVEVNTRAGLEEEFAEWNDMYEF
jgi:phage terminase large subunit-like protein